MMVKTNILIVEDDKAIADAVAYTLEQEEFRLIHAGSMSQALPYLGKKDIGLYLLDVMLPDGTGYDLCRKVKRYHDVPVIFLTACDEEANIVMGLDIGADDYIVKPFRGRELISRIRSVLRRYDGRQDSGQATVYHAGDIKVLAAEGKVYCRGEEICLSALEYKLLLYLIRHEGQIVTREQLLSHIYDMAGEYVNDNTLTVYIKRLRDKLESHPGHPGIIRTVRGLGYTIGETHV